MLARTRWFQAGVPRRGYLRGTGRYRIALAALGHSAALNFSAPPESLPSVFNLPLGVAMHPAFSFMSNTIIRPAPQRGPIRYRNHFRWRVMPPDGASDLGLFDRSFQNKKQAVAYQKQVKARFPNEPCCLIDTGRWHDSFGRIIR